MVPKERILDVAKVFDLESLPAAKELVKAKNYVGKGLALAYEGVPNSVFGNVRSSLKEGKSGEV